MQLPAAGAVRRGADTLAYVYAAQERLQTDGICTIQHPS